MAKSIIVEKKLIVPTNYKLQTIYQYCTKRNLENHHNAEHDVNATVTILKWPQFWSSRRKCMQPIDMQRIQNIQNNKNNRNYVHENNDSDTENNSDLEEGVDNSIYDTNVNKNDNNSAPIFHPRQCEKFCLQIWSQKNFLIVYNLEESLAKLF